jgi:hypothetical protein
MAFKGLDRMKKAMDKVQDLQEKDPNEMAAQKLNKEIQEVQAKQKKEFDMPKKNMPLNDDMGPLPEKKYKKGGMVKSSASKRADGCATKGKTKGRII